MTARIQTMIVDSSGVSFDPDSLPHTYAYNEDGTLASDTCVESSGLERVKTYTYDAGMLTGESGWVQQ
jgi:hypothetical protein